MIQDPVLYPPTYRHDYYSFLVYDENNKLKYSRYNFDYIGYALEHNKLQLSVLNTGQFILYPDVNGSSFVNGTSEQSSDFTQFNFSNAGTLGYIIGNNGEYNGENAYYKLSIWQDFWANINGDYSLPYAVPTNMEKYFTPITQKIQDYVSKYGVFHGEYSNITSVDNLLIEPTVMLPRLSSELINFTDRQIRRIQDYYFIEPPNQFIYSKYNFDFEQYSIDFQMVDTHLVLFTDFYIRNKVLNGVSNFVLGEGIYTPFKKYFKQSMDLTYLETNSVLTNFYAGVKSFYNIDFDAFVTINNLQDPNPQETFMTTYQFQQLQVPFYTNKDFRNSIEKSSCSVVFQENVGTGFLIDMNDNKQYLITDSKMFYASFNATTFFAIFQQNGINMKIQFKVVGFVRYADVLLGVFDPLLSYNQTNGITAMSIPSIPIVLNNDVLNNDVLNGDKLYTSGSYDMSCPFNLISGFVTDNMYTDNFQTTVNGLPESILLDASSKKGCFGGPVWKNDDLGNPILVGMLTRSMYDGQLSIVCKIKPILNIMNLNSQNNAPCPIDYTMYFRGLALVSKYVHPLLQQQYHNLNNLNYIGGIYVNNIILGYNTSTNTPIYSINNINYQNVKFINNLFIGTKFYNYVLSNGAVIKSLNGILMGKFFGQRPYSDFIYGVGPFKPIGTKPIPSRFTEKYVNLTVNVYNPIIVEYFYYNGNNWELTVETIGINDENDLMYVEDSIGNYKYVQHRSECCVSLNQYEWKSKDE